MLSSRASDCRGRFRLLAKMNLKIACCLANWRLRVIIVFLENEGPVATTGDSKGKVKVSGVAGHQPLAPEADSRAPLQAPALEVGCPIMYPGTCC